MIVQSNSPQKCTILTITSLLVFCCNSRSMTPITGQAAVNDEEQRPLLQDILEAAVAVFTTITIMLLNNVALKVKLTINIFPNKIFP